jgi:hypothetical protein
MLDWITGRTSEHPMADLKRVHEAIAGLPSDNSLRALEEMTRWLESLSEPSDIKLQSRLDAIDLLDRAAKNHQFKVAPEYLEAPRLQKFYESRLWNTSFGFWRALGNGYIACIEQYQGSAPGAATARKHMPMIADRALRTLTLQLKWILLRYGLIEDRIWRDLGRAYLFAESQGFAAHRAQVYPGKHGESTAQEELLKALMLASSSPDGLPPVSVHIAERVVAHFANGFILNPQPAAGCGFCFDLSVHRPPTRVVKTTQAGTLVRYFGPGAAVQALRDLARAIREKGGIPGDINLGGEFDPKTVAAVLDHLDQYWGDNILERSTERHDLATRVTVVPGFAESLVWLQSATDATSLEFSDPASAESWIVFNASDGGFGTVVPKMKGDWLHVGCLVGLRTETSNLCRVGIVRRMTRDRYNQRRVGIQVLESTAMPVSVAFAAASQADKSTSHAEGALLLSSRPDRNREVAVLMRAGSFTAKRHLHMTMPAGAYLLAPVGLVEAGEDFDWARYRIADRLLNG